MRKKTLSLGSHCFWTAVTFLPLATQPALTQTEANVEALLQQQQQH